PRSVDRIDFDRAQHDRSQYADRRLAQAIAIARPAIADSPGAIAEHQPGIAGKGPLARAPEPGSGKEEHGSRAGPSSPRRKGEATRADVEVQVRVPRQHVARTSHAAQQPAHPLGSAFTQ